MLDNITLLYVALLFILTIILHELTHYLVLRKMGGSGKLCICKGSFNFPTIGIHYKTGLKNWEQVVYWKLAPMPITFIGFYFMSFKIVDPVNYLGNFIVLLFALVLTWITCLKDMRDARYILAEGTEKNFNELFNNEMCKHDRES